MSDIRCVICTRRQPHDGWTVCDTCLAHLDDNLARIVELTRLAAGWLAPRSGSGDTVRAVPASRPPLDVAALDAALGNDVLPLLEEWEKDIRDRAHLSPYGLATAVENATVARSVAFLRSWLLWAAETPAFNIHDMAEEVRDLTNNLEHLDPNHDRDQRSKLKCPGDHPDADGRRCHARIYFDREHPSEDIECRRCGSIWTGTRLFLLALGDESQRIWRTPAEIIELVDVSKRSVQRWAETGMVERNGTRYDLGQVWRLRMRVGA